MSMGSKNVRWTLTMGCLCLVFFAFKGAAQSTREPDTASNTDSSNGTQSAETPQQEEQEAKTEVRQSRYGKAHRFVFFAVLEGCYEDGLNQEAVDLIVPKRENAERDNIANFVYTCPLCCPTFDAIHTYALRPRFLCVLKRREYGDEFKTFGLGLDEEVMRQLAGTGRERRGAIQSLMEKWIDARMKRQRFNDAETKELRQQLAQMRKTGEAALKRFQQNAHGEQLAAAYADWKACPICSGASPMGQ